MTEAVLLSSPAQPAREPGRPEVLSGRSFPNGTSPHGLPTYGPGVEHRNVRAPVDAGPLETLLPRVGAAVARHHRRLAARHGLTPTALAVLASLDTGSAPSHRDLAARVGLSPATITPVLDRLEAAAEIRRERDPGDRRVVRVHRTAAGVARLAGATSPDRLPRPAPEIEEAVRTWLLAVLAAAETDD
jgi:DNA-binding MarR family transcriptional regulator